MEKEKGLIGDFFCGAGGASVGIEEAFGRSVDFAVNHDQTAIKLHSRNHPSTYHMTEDIFTADVEKFVAGRKVSLLWASLDCTHFSRAKGKTPRKQGIRMLPFAVYYHAAQIRPEVICMENVAEIQNWGTCRRPGRSSWIWTAGKRTGRLLLQLFCSTYVTRKAGSGRTVIRDSCFV